MDVSAPSVNVEKTRSYYNWLPMTAPNFSAVRALIFDLDGTLIDSQRDLIRSVNAMLREMGREQLHEDTISGYIGHGAPQLVAPYVPVPVPPMVTSEAVGAVPCPVHDNTAVIATGLFAA